MPGTYPPSNAASSTSAFFPIWELVGYNGAPGSGGVVLAISTAAQAYCSVYKACTIYMVSFSIYSTNSAAAQVSIQPYGAAAGGNGNFAGTAKSVAVPASGGPVFYAQAVTISMTTAGYMGLAATVTSGTTSIIIALDATLWATQASQ